jgi:uncharacterized protein YaiI (UPF0178 family)
MQIWIDADACPKPVKEIVFRAAARTSTQVTLVANQPLSVPPSPLIRAIQVSSGFDVADNYIVETAVSGDLLVTADIPLAAEAVAKGLIVVNPRGEEYTRENVRQRLNMRDFMETLRSSGINSGGPAPYSQQDRQAFANSLDRLLARFRPAT